MRLNYFQLSENFNLKEFECPCCHTVLLNPLLVSKLQKLRDEWGQPLIITSGYRCEFHNREVGGVKRSLHRLGQAADVQVMASVRDRFRDLAAECGFSKAIGYSERNFFHLEIS